MSPEIDVERMELVVVFILISRIVRWKMPLTLVYRRTGYALD